MKKFLISISVMCVLILTIAVAVTAASETDYKSLAQNVSNGLKSVFQDENAAKKSVEVAGIILGEEVSSQQFEIRAKAYELTGSKAPYTDAWNSFKIQVYEHQYAKEHGILPSEEEIKTFSSEMRKAVESSPEGREVQKILFEGMGMTADEYWNDYKIKYEAPYHLTKIKINDYITANKLEALDETTILKEVVVEKMDPIYENKI
ncbi:MAG: hypothetical protein PHQ50_04630 [Eubacteriales bacterium]|nr:hypothetical protein [Eubacteriales bacterium]MDD3350197.1 hypothetical protein [Eubacteriales bacterium]